MIRPASTSAQRRVTRPDIQHRSIAVDPERRTQLLRHLIQHQRKRTHSGLAATKYATEHIATKLQRLNRRASPARRSQPGRTHPGTGRRQNRAREVLIATDVAARGIDVVDLPAVVNFDLPRSTADDVHRTGRTQRRASGVAVSFVSAATEGTSG